jgi:hypothetical protein
MRKEFVMRGKTASGGTEVLNFTGRSPGHGFRMVDMVLVGSGDLGATSSELVGTVTCGKTAISPIDPDFNDEALIAVWMGGFLRGESAKAGGYGVINDLFVIKTDLILMVQDTSGNNNPVNWQLRFKEIKLSGSEEAVANYRQFTISDG